MFNRAYQFKESSLSQVIVADKIIMFVYGCELCLYMCVLTHQAGGNLMAAKKSQVAPLQGLRVRLTPRVRVWKTESELVDILLSVKAKREGQDIVVAVLRRSVVVHVLSRHPLPKTHKMSGY